MRIRPTEDRERMELFLDLKKNAWGTIKTIVPITGFRPKLTEDNGWSYSIFNRMFNSPKYEIWYKEFKKSKTKVWLLVAVGSRRAYRIVKHN